MRLNRKGTILIASLWILAILSILAIGIGFRISIEGRLARYNMDRLRSLYIAKAGVVKAQDLLFEDNNGYDTMRECGISLTNKVIPESDLEGIFSNIECGDGRYSIGYTQDGKIYYGSSDCERRININTASQATLEDLMLRLGIEDAPEIAASIIFWRGEAAGSPPDDSYYQSLDRPYERKKEKFSVIEELLLVKGVTPEVFDKMKDYVTIYGSGKVNVNTAPEFVLAAAAKGAAGGTSPGISDIAVNNIIAQRSMSQDKLESQKGLIIANIDTDLFPAPSQEDLAKIKNSFTTVSNYFRIESTGKADRSKVEKRIVCIAQKDPTTGESKLVSYREY